MPGAIPSSESAILLAVPIRELALGSALLASCAQHSQTAQQ
jgi:hypothetical protein